MSALSTPAWFTAASTGGFHDDTEDGEEAYEEHTLDGKPAVQITFLVPADVALEAIRTTLGDRGQLQFTKGEAS